MMLKLNMYILRITTSHDFNMKRQEEKFFLQESELPSLLSKFSLFNEHPMRQINSIYYDNKNFDAFNDSEEGIVPRSKYRYRWYGDKKKILNNGHIEIKKTFEFHKEKSVKAFKFKKISEIKNYFSGLCSQEFIPICQVSYQRIYYRNFNGLRFTYDFNITIKRPNLNLFKPINEKIFEIKYPSDMPNDLFSSMLGDKKTRFSKYNKAVLELYA